MRLNRQKIAAFFLIAALFIGTSKAQTSFDVPHTMSYQGQLSSSASGDAMNGTHTISATIFTNPDGAHSIWQGTYNANITNGIFDITLGSGNYPLPEVTSMNRPLWVGISIDGGEIMKPLTQLSAAPYALNIPDQSVTLSKLAPDVMSSIGSINNPKPQAIGDKVLLGGQAYSGASQGDEWIGSNNSYEVWFETNSTVAMRYVPTAGTPNIIGGNSGNSIPTGVNAVICGGGATSSVNTINSSGCIIGAGLSNTIGTHAEQSCLMGGDTNTINDYNEGDFIGGGGHNLINDSCPGSIIVGGLANTVQSTHVHNQTGQLCSIVGGDHLTAQSYCQTVMGYYNIARGNSTVTAPGYYFGEDPLLMIGNGNSTTKSNAFEVRDSGSSLVFRVNGTGVNTAARLGGTYQDNVIYAAGHGNGGNINVVGTSVMTGYDFGVLSGTWVANGHYRITLNLVDAGGTAHSLSDAAISVTIVNSNNAASPWTASATVIAANVFDIYTTLLTNGGVYAPALKNAEFTFQVTGRP